jgi:hypothetical protein
MLVNKGLTPHSQVQGVIEQRQQEAVEAQLLAHNQHRHQQQDQQQRAKVQRVRSRSNSFQE